MKTKSDQLYATMASTLKSLQGITILFIWLTVRTVDLYFEVYIWIDFHRRHVIKISFCARLSFNLSNNRTSSQFEMSNAFKSIFLWKGTSKTQPQDSWLPSK